MIVILQNPSTDDLKKTYMAQSYNIGATSIETKSNTEFSNALSTTGFNQLIQIGESGLASTEIVTISAANANGTTMTISATLYPHEADAPIYLLQFDQAKLYRSTTGINGTYTLMANCPFTIDVTSADLESTYNDNNAAAGYYYKWTVYNSVSTVESSYSDPIPAITGWARNQAGYLINQVYDELSDANEDNLTRDEMLGYINEVNDDLTMQVVRPYNFLYTRQAFGRVAGSNTLAWPKDSMGNNAMWKFDRMDYNFVDNTTTPVTNNTYTVPVVDLAYFRNRWTTNENDTTTQDDTVQEMALDEAMHTFNYYPYSATSSNAVWYLYYWAFFNQISSEGDVLQTPTPKIYKHYISYKYYLKKAVTDPSYMVIAKQHQQDYVFERARLKSQDRRDVGTPRRFGNEGWVRRSFRR
jgi:hypothetical protein